MAAIVSIGAGKGDIKLPSPDEVKIDAPLLAKIVQANTNAERAAREASFGVQEVDLYYRFSPPTTPSDAEKDGWSNPTATGRCAY